MSTQERVIELEQENRTLFVRNIQLETGIENKKIHIESLNKKNVKLEMWLLDAVKLFDEPCTPCDCFAKDTCRILKLLALKQEILKELKGEIWTNQLEKN